MFATYARLLRSMRPHTAAFALAFVSMVLMSAATSATAFLAGPLLRFVVSGGHEGADGLARVWAFLPSAIASRVQSDLPTALPWLLLTVGLVRGVGYLGQFFFMGMLGQRVVADLRAALHQKILELSPNFFAQRGTGELLSRFSTDIGSVEFAVTYGIAAYVRDSMQLAFLLALSFYIDWRLALLTFVAVPVTLVPVVRFAKRLKAIATQGQAQMGRLTQAFHESISGVRTAQAFGAESRERARFAEENARFLAIMRKSFLVRAAFTPTLELVGVVGFALGIHAAMGAIARGTLSGEQLLSFAATVLLMYQPLKSLGGVGQFVVQGVAGAERLFALLDEKSDIADAPNTTPAAPFVDEIRFEDVSLRYPPRPGETGRGELVLRGITIAIPRGKMVALVGASGSGKSTLANLLPRFLDPTFGRVLLDGADLRTLTLSSLRAQIALVAQENFLFNDTIAANIRYGRPAASLADLREVARAARALDFIDALPQGFDTLVGERGVTLSGGQKQRIAIARALLKDAPILVLDEATSALDTENEREVQRALAALMEHRTTLVIAHRLSTIRHADRICVLGAGRLVEEGRHDELLALDGAYAKLYASQFDNPDHSRENVF